MVKKVRKTLKRKKAKPAVRKAVKRKTAKKATSAIKTSTKSRNSGGGKDIKPPIKR